LIAVTTADYDDPNTRHKTKLFAITTCLQAEAQSRKGCSKKLVKSEIGNPKTENRNPWAQLSESGENRVTFFVVLCVQSIRVKMATQTEGEYRNVIVGD